MGCEQPVVPAEAEIKAQNVFVDNENGVGPEKVGFSYS